MPLTDDPIARIRTEVQIMFYDTDCAGVVHNMAYLRFIEEARTKLAEQLGMPLSQMLDEGRYPVVVRTDHKRGHPKRGQRYILCIFIRFLWVFLEANSPSLPFSCPEQFSLESLTTPPLAIMTYEVIQDHASPKMQRI